MDRKVELERALDALWGALDVKSESVAGLVREIRAVTAELEAIPQADGKVSKADELRKRRAKRHGKADDSAPTSGRGQPRRSNGSHRAG